MGFAIKLAVVLAAPLLFFSGCQDSYTSTDVVQSSAEEDAEETKHRELLVGRWYGNQPRKGGGSHRFINERKNDGSYRIVIRQYNPDAQYEEHIEKGRWGHTGPIYFSIFEAITFGSIEVESDPEEPLNYDAYEILSLTKDEFVYKSFRTGDVFTTKRVEEDFSFPGSRLRKTPKPPPLVKEEEPDPFKPRSLDLELVRKSMDALSERFLEFCLSTNGDLEAVTVLMAQNSHWTEPFEIIFESGLQREWRSLVKGGFFILSTGPLERELGSEHACRVSTTAQRVYLKRAKEEVEPALASLSKFFVIGETVENPRRSLYPGGATHTLETNLVSESAPKARILHQWTSGTHTLAILFEPKIE